MLPEIGATELLVIAVIALIVVGPKDLPLMLRKLGQFVARMRGMASEFRSSFDEMARQSELDELRKEVAAMRAGRISLPEVEETFGEIDHHLREPELTAPITPAPPPQIEAAEPAPKKPRKPRAKKKPAEPQA